MKKLLSALLAVMFIFAGIMPVNAEERHMSWLVLSSGKYWYENGERQGVYGDPKNIWDEQYGIERGREIYDPGSNAWYWLDACKLGARAEHKEVWMPYMYQNETPGSTNGKWVRYDDTGKMIKGWFIWRSVVGLKDGKRETVDKFYYYDPITGAMTKGHVKIGKYYYYDFDEATGVLKGYNDLYVFQHDHRGNADNYRMYDEARGVYIYSQFR